MRIVVYGKEWQFKESLTVREVMQRLGINPQAAVAIRDGEALRLDETIGRDDIVHFVDMIAGG